MSQFSQVLLQLCFFLGKISALSHQFAQICEEFLKAHHRAYSKWCSRFGRRFLGRSPLHIHLCSYLRKLDCLRRGTFADPQFLGFINIFRILVKILAFGQGVNPMHLRLNFARKLAFQMNNGPGDRCMCLARFASGRRMVE